MVDADRRANTSEDRTFYVINMCASPVPLPLEMPGSKGLEGLVVFRSHEIQDGRHRYRLHLGYFETRDAAERALPLVQSQHPTAWIAAAPRARLGSLDDTGTTDFRLIQAPASSFSAFTAADAPPPQRAAPAAPPAPVEAAQEEQPQRYAVQLIWSADRTSPADLPPIALFDAYTLYTVTCQRGGVRLFGVRLGFFRSAISASQVAVYVRSDFPSVAVVPVSDREFAYASWLVRHRGESDPDVGRAPRIAADLAERPLEETAAAIRALDSELSPDLAPAATKAATPATPQRPVERQTPTQVEIAQIRSPDEIPLAAFEPVQATIPPRTPASRHWAYSARRVPDLDREARLAALGAHEIELRAAKFDPHDERGEVLPEKRPYRSAPFPERRSVFARLLTRIADRLN